MIDVTAKNATGKPALLPKSAGIVITSAATDHEQHRPGRRPCCAFRRRHSWWPGTAPSREKANVIREALATQPIPQNSWPIVEMSSTSLASAGAQRRLDDRDRELPPAALIVVTCVAANVSASSSDPADRPPSRRSSVQSPSAAASLGVVGLLGEVGRGVVAGERVHRQQEAERQDVEPVHAWCRLKPALLRRCPNTNETLWRDGWAPKIRMTTITATPIDVPPDRDAG